MKQHALVSVLAVALLAISACADVDESVIVSTSDESAAAAASQIAEDLARQAEAQAASVEEMRRLAELGDAGAQYELAVAYEVGTGVRRDAREARSWYLRAAAGGNREAQYKAGLLYEGGFTVPKDLGEALNWYRRADNQGHEMAGRRVPELERALAAIAADAIARAQVAAIRPAVAAYERRDYAVAYQEFSRLAGQDNPGAQFHLGLMYDRGTGVPQDAVAARNWYVTAASNGHADAQYKVGAMNEFGHLVLKNPHGALAWYRQAAAEGHRLAQRRVDELERTLAIAAREKAPATPLEVAGTIGTGDGAAMEPSTSVATAGSLTVDTPSLSPEPADSTGVTAPEIPVSPSMGQSSLIADVQAALAAYDQSETVSLAEKTRRLAERGDPQAQYELGAMYAKGGGGLIQDVAAAARWYRRAADHGIAQAQFDLGVLYSDGRGVAKDDGEAERLYRDAARQGIAEAQAKLDALVILAASRETADQEASDPSASSSSQQSVAPPVTRTDTLQEYRIGAGDRLGMTVYGHDDLSGEFLVDGSGRVSLPLLGQVNANNKTITEFQNDVAVALDRDFIVNPRVSVEVVNYRPFFILGQVNNPGSYSYIEGMTARMAVALAGGFTRRARESTVVVVRGNDPEQKRIDVGLETSVLPGDTIEVERRFF